MVLQMKNKSKVNIPKKKKDNIDYYIFLFSGVILVAIILLGVYFWPEGKKNVSSSEPASTNKKVYLDNVAVNELDSINASLTNYAYELFNNSRINSDMAISDKLVLTLKKLEETYDFNFDSKNYNTDKTTVTITFGSDGKIVSVETFTKKIDSNSGE